MKNFNKLVICAAISMGISGSALATNTDTQTVNFEVSAINELTLGAAVTLTVNSATAGSQPNAATDSSDYALTTNGTGKKITAAIDTVMGTGLTLTVNVTAPSGGTSAGVVDISNATTAVDVVSGITQVTGSAIAIDYSLAATVDAGVVAAASKTATYTITDSA